MLLFVGLNFLIYFGFHYCPFLVQSQARLTATIVFAFLERGVPAQSIGVIALYRAQANRVRQILEQRWSQSQPGSSGSCNPEAGAEGGGATAVAVSTVDAFQVKWWRSCPWEFRCLIPVLCSEGS